MFLPMNFLPKKRAFKKDNDRTTPVHISYSSHYVDTITYHLPENYHLEFVPDEVEIKSAFGSYQIKIEQEQQTLRYFRFLHFKKGSYAPERYNELVNFLKEIRSADLKKIVLVNKT